MIEILVPTHKRQKKLNQMIRSIKDTADNIEEICVTIYIDKTDYSYKEIEYTPNRRLIKGTETILSKMWNKCWEHSTGEILMHAADDIIFETKGWDIIVRDHFKKHPISLLYGRDGHQDENCSTHSFTTAKAAKHLGYFVPPYFEADWNDMWLMHLYKGINKLFYEPKIMTRHNHVNVNEKFNDATYELAKDRRKSAALMWDKKRDQIKKDVKKLKKLL